jgi:hypothetical protein
VALEVLGELLGEVLEVLVVLEVLGEVLVILEVLGEYLESLIWLFLVLYVIIPYYTYYYSVTS